MARKEDSVVISGTDGRPHESPPEEAVLVSNENASKIKVDAVENRNNLPTALVIESIPCMAEILRGYNWNCESYHPTPLLRAHLQQVFDAMQARRYDFVWIRRPGRDSMQRGRRASFERACVRLMFLAEALSIFAVHCSYLKSGELYRDESLQAGLKVSEHYYGYFGVRQLKPQVRLKPHTHDYKEMACRLLSTKKILSHENIRHATVKEFNASSAMQAESFVLSQLVKEWFQQNLFGVSLSALGLAGDCGLLSGCLLYTSPSPRDS